MIITKIQNIKCPKGVTSDRIAIVPVGPNLRDKQTESGKKPTLRSECRLLGVEQKELGCADSVANSQQQTLALQHFDELSNYESSSRRAFALVSVAPRFPTDGPAQRSDARTLTQIISKCDELVKCDAAIFV